MCILTSRSRLEFRSQYVWDVRDMSHRFFVDADRDSGIATHEEASGLTIRCRAVVISAGEIDGRLGRVQVGADQPDCAAGTTGALSARCTATTASASSTITAISPATSFTTLLMVVF